MKRPIDLQIVIKRDNGYGRSPNTPALEFEMSPFLYASEIEDYYFGIKGKPFDQVEYKNLKKVVFIDKNIPSDILETIYDGNYGKYFDETATLLEVNGNTIMKTKFAKSVTAWIYSGDDYVTNYNIAQEKAIEKLEKSLLPVKTAIVN